MRIKNGLQIKTQGTIMAILRGGRRIGNYDIRIGLTRDESLVDIAKGPRLQKTNNWCRYYTKIFSQINQGEGFSRTNRFICKN